MNKLRECNNVICCITCAVQAVQDDAKNGVWRDLPAMIWENSWNVSIPSEEEEAYNHSITYPNHIMLKGLDWGYTVNGV